MKTDLLFSVIIPTYHRNDLLAKCLERLSPGVQTFPFERYEVIVTDDGRESTAKSLVEQKYPWVKWVEGPQKGPAANRNNGAQHAKGVWLVFTDDDCLPESNWLDAFSESIKSNVWVYEGQTTCMDGIHSPLDHAPVNITGGYLWSCNLMILKTLFHRLKGFDDNFPYPHLEDVDFRERIEQSGNAFIFVEKAKIDHPPKRLPYGKQMGRLQECTIYYWMKTNQNESVLRIVNLLFYSRIRTICKFQIQFDSILALFSFLEELLYTCKMWTTWRLKYQQTLEKI